MTKRVLFYLSKSDTQQWVARVSTVEIGRRDADATLGLGDWTEYDLTMEIRQFFQDLVNVARERARTADGTGRWRWRTVANVLKRWLGEPTDETCETCGQSVPSI